MITKKREMLERYKKIERPFRVLAYMVIRNLNNGLENHLYIEETLYRMENVKSNGVDGLFLYRRAKFKCSHPGFFTGDEEFEAMLFLSIMAQYANMYKNLKDNKLALYLECFELIEQEVDKIKARQEDLYKTISRCYTNAISEFCAYNRDLIPNRGCDYEEDDNCDRAEFELVVYENGETDIQEDEKVEEDDDSFDYNVNYDECNSNFDYNKNYDEDEDDFD